MQQAKPAQHEHEAISCFFNTMACIAHKCSGILACSSARNESLAEHPYTKPRTPSSESTANKNPVQPQQRYMNITGQPFD